MAKSERKILAALAKPDAARRFAADPFATLTGLRIEVPPIIKQRLKAASLTGDAPTCIGRGPSGCRTAKW
ncbi:hypothetical protein H7H78_14630 [Mycobacterium shinjukuense]|uniref:Uncharacterized protein n=1 Tax=Mycobacterium shinjukuense TaxID=398694 RepID=A0A7I7MMK5_9MYCO|nr:hypothetical protein [Mycobacterium shinjukuense]MCV6986614.1 hypothetical protein [Mycobacterium shinjukuense]ORB61534.1 hypothetical protein BST45_19855 [Mycobacterium shinjukuense]BBX72987.1 hypothetical protein MSHI_08930 [Mycobacterium shinjukuense]